MFNLFSLFSLGRLQSLEVDRKVKVPLQLFSAAKLLRAEAIPSTVHFIGSQTQVCTNILISLQHKRVWK